MSFASASFSPIGSSLGSGARLGSPTHGHGLHRHTSVPKPRLSADQLVSLVCPLVSESFHFFVLQTHHVFQFHHHRGAQDYAKIRTRKRFPPDISCHPLTTAVDFLARRLVHFSRSPGAIHRQSIVRLDEDQNCCDINTNTCHLCPYLGPVLSHAVAVSTPCWFFCDLTCCPLLAPAVCPPPSISPPVRCLKNCTPYLTMRSGIKRLESWGVAFLAPPRLDAIGALGHGRCNTHGQQHIRMAVRTNSIAHEQKYA